jgi:hypothetical protein
MNKNQDDGYSEKEAAARFEAARTSGIEKVSAFPRN